MKRVKAACILQTLVFMQKEDCGLSRNAILETNRRELAHYKHTLEHTHTRYQIDSVEEQENGSIIIRVRKQYNDKADVAEYFQQSNQEGLFMKEYEIVAKFCNACAGSSRPQTYFEEAALASTDDFVRMKHGHDFDKFKKEVLPDGRIMYTYGNGSVSYSYEFTEL